MSWKLTPAEEEALADLVREDLARVVRRAVTKTDKPFRIDLPVARTEAYELKLMEQGKSKVKDPYSSKHVIGPKRAKAEAVDLYPRDKTLNLNDHNAYADIHRAMTEAAKEERVSVRNGWDLWKWDAPHWQV